MTTIQPKITVLSDEQAADLHRHSLHILSSVGIRVDSDKAKSVLCKKGGCPSDADRVYIPHELVEWALDAAPPQVVLFNRKGKSAFVLGRDQPCRFGIGVTNLYYQEPAADEVIPFTRDHMRTSVRLGQSLDSMDAVSTVGILQDISPEKADLYATLEMTCNTIKPLVMLISEEKLFEPSLDLLESLHGDLKEKPSVIPYFNPISPLVLNKRTSDAMSIAIRRGLPFIYSNYGMSGATTPMKPAGTLALLNAELLAGLVFTQLIKEGCPVIMGSLPAAFNMRSMGSFYSPHSQLLNLACAEMMAQYDLPHSGISGSGIGWGADLLMAGDFWMTFLTSCAGKAGLSPFIGGNFDSKVFSPASVVYADYAIRKIRSYAAGFDFDDEAIGHDEIAEIGPGGNFLLSPSTLQLCRTFHPPDPVWPDMSLEKWQEQGEPKAEKCLREKTVALLDAQPAPDNYYDMIEEGERFIRRYKTSG